ncbi:ATP-dependent RNA helicase DbpA [Pseudidiomarina sp. 1APP75-32.1]|uniref:ATP-dependent RNA helicase DbpA n=1 Tax=Pseudidiomarina terrestris TaxID=2820060 RepID=A0AAW7QXZ6_9GAMM|nr:MULTISPECIES: ATP-dependent RNA helicase DbpA [unclassified Pseudidiomarina]MDN7123436.1 ATP-dependent RNA helicase DbpA [Pseudidiomarina sp. 1APP75-32.1]MDN7128838.1 ATP-dependent RNA helicase DbpA [Pseudidiomarina sp. 1APR75-15]
MSESNPANSPETTPAVRRFNELKLSDALLSSLQDAGFEQMTDVQAYSLPKILRAEDVVVQAETGSGKTVAFALGVLSKLDTSSFAPQALVLCPTRELAEQVAEAIRALAKAMGNVKVLTLCGGVPARSQAASLEHGAHILVGTPGRILDHLQQERIDFASLQSLVLDEADRMLEMGFEDELKGIVAKLPAARQTLLFSATYPQGIRQLTKQMTRDADIIKVAATQTQTTIRQRFYQQLDTPAAEAVERVLLELQPGNCMVFCTTKVETQNLADTLAARGHSAIALHGDMEQKDRDQAMVRFSNGSARILVATDVASRGLDVAELDLVISVHLAHDIATHTHRIGRTGRAGAEGLAVTVVGIKDDYRLRLLEDTLSAPIQLQPLPERKSDAKPLVAAYVTVQLNGGKKDKLRPGDIVGALTRDQQLSMDDIGKIKVQAQWAYVAVKTNKTKHALALLNNDKIKNKRFRARTLLES